MVKLVSVAANCSVPWNQIKIHNLKDCSSPSDFLNYLKSLESLQNKIKYAPKKCTFSSWTSHPFHEIEYEMSGETQIFLSLLLPGGKVKIKHFKELFVQSGIFFTGHH